MSRTVYEIEVPGIEPVHRGKVRSVYDAGDHLVLVASDRVSAYDVVLPTPIPDKGRVLTQLSAFWFERLAAAAPHHLVSVERDDLPAPFRAVPELEGRTMWCRRARPVLVECIVRGYLAGSGLREYRAHGTLHGEPLPAGLRAGDRLPEPRFTPTTKAREGHDEPMSWEAVVAQEGRAVAELLRRRSLALYQEAHGVAAAVGLVLADAKFEFGWVGDQLLLIDELFSPDASRFWDVAAHARGELEPFDKQFLRDWLDASGWDHAPPAPELPEWVVQQTRERYVEAARRLMGEAAARRAGLVAAGAG